MWACSKVAPDRPRPSCPWRAVRRRRRRRARHRQGPQVGVDGSAAALVRANLPRRARPLSPNAGVDTHTALRNHVGPDMPQGILGSGRRLPKSCAQAHDASGAEAWNAEVPDCNSNANTPNDAKYSRIFGSDGATQLCMCPLSIGMLVPSCNLKTRSPPGCHILFGMQAAPELRRGQIQAKAEVERRRGRHHPTVHARYMLPLRRHVGAARHPQDGRAPRGCHRSDMARMLFCDGFDSNTAGRHQEKKQGERRRNAEHGGKPVDLSPIALSLDSSRGYLCLNEQGVATMCCDSTKIMCIFRLY